MKSSGNVLFLILVGMSGCSTDEPTPSDNSVAFKAEDPRQAVQRILSADMTAERRMAALEQYINVGCHAEQVEKLLGPLFSGSGHGPGFLIADYGEWPGPGLTAHYYPDGEVCSLSYRGKDGKSVTLRSDDPITWPKTTEGKNAAFRRGRDKGG